MQQVNTEAAETTSKRPRNTSNTKCCSTEWELRCPSKVYWDTGAKLPHKCAISQVSKTSFSKLNLPKIMTLILYLICKMVFNFNTTTKKKCFRNSFCKQNTQNLANSEHLFLNIIKVDYFLVILIVFLMQRKLTKNNKNNCLCGLLQYLNVSNILNIFILLVKYFFFRPANFRPVQPI